MNKVVCFLFFLHLNTDARDMNIVEQNIKKEETHCTKFLVKQLVEFQINFKLVRFQ